MYASYVISKHFMATFSMEPIKTTIAMASRLQPQRNLLLFQVRAQSSHQANGTRSTLQHLSPRCSPQ
jgi:hypothetical protein